MKDPEKSKSSYQKEHVAVPTDHLQGHSDPSVSSGGRSFLFFGPREDDSEGSAAPDKQAITRRPIRYSVVLVAAGLLALLVVVLTSMASTPRKHGGASHGGAVGVVETKTTATSNDSSMPSHATALTRQELQVLDQIISGKVYFEGETPGFAEAARVWREDLRPPMAVIEVANEQDVQKAVPVLGRLSRDANLSWRIRSGGHNKAGFSTVPGGVVLSLKKMDSVHLPTKVTVGPTATDSVVAIVEPGARVEQVLDELLAGEGYSGALGQCGNVAEGGWVLGGGIGFMSRLLGLGIDNVHEMRVVLANGTVQVASPTDDSDLFWALNGAGSGNFGVVTSMKYQYYRSPENQLFKLIPLPLDDTMAKFLCDLGNLNATGEFMIIVGGRQGNSAVGYASWFSLDAHVVEQGDAHFEREIAPILPQYSLESNATAAYQVINWPTGTHQLFDHGYGVSVWAAQSWQGFLMPANNTEEVWKDILSTFREAFRVAPNLEPHIEQWGGAISKRDSASTAFPYRQAVYLVGFLLVIQETDGDDARRSFDSQVASVNALWPSVAKYLHGAYLNYPMSTLSPQEYPRLYWGHHLGRLVELKRRYDPDNIFAYEQSVPLSL